MFDEQYFSLQLSNFKNLNSSYQLIPWKEAQSMPEIKQFRI